MKGDSVVSSSWLHVGRKHNPNQGSYSRGENVRTHTAMVHPAAYRYTVAYLLFVVVLTDQSSINHANQFVACVRIISPSRPMFAYERLMH